MSEHLKTTFEWKLKVKVPGNASAASQPTRDQIAADARVIMDNATQSKFAETMAKNGITDYSFVGIVTEIQSVSEPKWEARLDFWNSGLTSEVTGKTTIEYWDVPFAPIIAACVVSVIAYLAANPVVVIIGLAAIIAILGAWSISGSITNLVAGTTESISSAIKAAGSNFSTTIITIGLILVVIIATVGFIIFLSPTARAWAGSAYSKAKNAIRKTSGNGRI